MSSKQATQAAARYMQDQAEIMKKHGEEPNVAGKTYASALRATTQTFRTISKAK